MANNDSVEIKFGASTDDAVAGIEAINADYATHSRAARLLVETMFDARIVLADLLTRAIP